MIVKRAWVTRRKATRIEKGEYVVSTWSGWFLFGIIPLYVKVTGVHSQERVSY